MCVTTAIVVPTDVAILEVVMVVVAIVVVVDFCYFLCSSLT